MFDVETTSYDTERGEIVEIGAARVANGAIADRWSTLVRPTRGILGKQVHGITEADVASAPSPQEAAVALLDWARGDLLVGHNVLFDVAFLNAVLPADRRVTSDDYMDTLALARGVYPDLGTHKLAEIVSALELGVEPTHRAAADAEATATLLLRLGADVPARVARYKAAVADSIRARKNGGDRAAADAALASAKIESGLAPSVASLLHKKVVRQLVLEEGVRMDGRDLDTIRPISVEVGLLPRAHGSGLFTRGRHAGADRRDAGLLVGHPADRHDQPGRVQALPASLQHAAVQHRREQADARPGPA